VYVYLANAEALPGTARQRIIIIIIIITIIIIIITTTIIIVIIIKSYLNFFNECRSLKRGWEK